MTTSTIDEAKEVVYGDREKTYGNPGKNIQTIASYWSVFLHSRGFIDRELLTCEDVCHMMSLLKMARLGNQPGHRDSLVDLIGYQALIDRISNDA